MSDLPTRTEAPPTASFADSWRTRPAEAVPDDGNNTVFELLILTVKDELNRTYVWRSGERAFGAQSGAWRARYRTGTGRVMATIRHHGCCRQMQPFDFQPARFKPGAGNPLSVYDRFWIGALSISQAGEPWQRDRSGDNCAHGHSLARRVPNRLSERPPRRRVIDRSQPVKRLIGKASDARHVGC